VGKKETNSHNLNGQNITKANDSPVESALSTEKNMRGISKKQNITKAKDSNDVSSPSTEKNRRRISKKQFLIISIVSVFFVAIVVVSTILIVKYFYSDDVDPGIDYSNPIRKEYSYAIDVSDEDGYVIDSSWLGDIDYSSLEIVFSEDKVLMLDSDFRLFLSNDEEDISPGMMGVIEFFSEGKLICKISVAILEASVYIHSKDELMSIPPGSQNIYIQTEDIDMAGESFQIENFSGKYYGNHRKIINLSFSGDKCGLFKLPQNALISSLTLDKFSAICNSSAESAYFGALADRAQNTEILYCISTGTITIETGSYDGLYVLGGLVGETFCLPRQRDRDIVNEISYCQTDVDLHITGKGYIFLGGVTGISKNVTIESCYSLGEIKIEASEATNYIRGIATGGICGSLEKEYSPSVIIEALDTCKNLYSYSDINIDIKGGGDGITVSAGGVFGIVINHGTINSGYYGDMYLRSGSCNLNAGGFSGEAENSTVWEMSFRGVTINGIIEIRSAGGVYAGGLAGITSNVLYSEITKVPLPSIETLSASGGPGSRPQIAEEYVASEL